MRQSSTLARATGEAARAIRASVLRRDDIATMT